MRTKTLLLTAALVAAGVASSMAQTSNVYSLNIVGYVNVPVQSGKFYLIQNPLNNTPDNTISNVFQASGFDSSGVADAGWNNAQILLWTGTGYATAIQYFSGFGWAGAGAADQTNLVGPGTGFFFLSTSNATLTFVGSVQLGSTNILKPGFSLVGSEYPASLPLMSLGLTGGDTDQILRWNSAAAGTGTFLTAIEYFANYGWLDPNAGDGAGPTNGPSLNVGEGIFYFGAGLGPNDAGPVNFTWAQSFTVN